MYPDGTNSQKNTPNASPAPSAAAGNGPVHRKIHAAHDRYFQDLTTVWNDAARDFLSMQNDFARSMEKAMQGQDMMAAQSAQADLQRGMQDAAMSPEARNRCMDAYRNYKQAVVQALASTNVDDLTYTDLTMLSQSLAIVAQNALFLAMTTCDPSQTMMARSQRTGQ